MVFPEQETDLAAEELLQFQPSGIYCHLPDEISHYEPELKFVFDLMIRKLHVNRHKGFGENVSLPTALVALKDELSELETALLTEGQFASLAEAADVANQAVIMALRLMRITKPEYENERSK